MDPVPSYLSGCFCFHHIGPGCFSPTYNLGRVPSLPHMILYVDRLVLVLLRKFLSVSVVVMALVVFSRLKPIAKILLIS